MEVFQISKLIFIIFKNERDIGFIEEIIYKNPRII